MKPTLIHHSRLEQARQDYSRSLQQAPSFALPQEDEEEEMDIDLIGEGDGFEEVDTP